MRYRAERLLAIGGGVTGAVQHMVSEYEEDYGTFGWGLADFELGVGHRWGIFAISFTLRPSIGFGPKEVGQPGLGPFFLMPAELGMAFYFSKKRRNAAITVTVGGLVGGPSNVAGRLLLGGRGGLGILLRL
ncbi:MAG: hypothetical protein ABI333_09885 [bacterium]